MRTYRRHRVKLFGGWQEYGCGPCFWLPSIYLTAVTYHNGREWNLHLVWLQFHYILEIVTAGLLEKNEGNPKYDPSDWEEHRSIWWHIKKHLKQVKI